MNRRRVHVELAQGANRSSQTALVLFGILGRSRGLRRRHLRIFLGVGLASARGCSRRFRVCLGSRRRRIFLWCIQSHTVQNWHRKHEGKNNEAHTTNLHNPSGSRNFLRQSIRSGQIHEGKKIYSFTVEVLIGKRPHAKIYAGQPASIHCLKTETRSAAQGSSGGIEPSATVP